MATGPDVNESGKTGLLAFAGQVQEAYTPVLNWPDAYKVYNEMRRRDPTIRTLWNALILFARTATWYAEAGGKADGDKRAADFVESCLEDMSHTVEDAVEDALSAVLFGWSWLEVVYKRRAGPEAAVASQYSDKAVGWRKWAMRRQSSFWQWEFDETGGVQALVQMPAPTYEQIRIPIEKSLHFTSQRDGGNPEGFPLLESIYETWYYLKNYQIIQGIGWQRTFVGLPVFEFEEKPQADDLAAVQTVGQALTVDEKQFVSVPTGVKFRLESAQNSGAEALLNTIKYYRLLMLQTTLADFIDLGTGQTGSWALGSDKSQLFLMAVDGYLDRVATVINLFGVPRLMGYNPFPGMAAMPRVAHSRVEKPALGQLGNWLQQVQSLLDWQPEDTNWLRRRTGMPVIEVAEGQPEEQGGGGAQEQGSTEEEETAPELAELAEGGHDAERAAIEAEIAAKVQGFLKEQQERVLGVAQAGQDVADAAFWAGEQEALKRVLLQQVLKHVVGLSGTVIEEAMAAFAGGADWALVNADAAKWARGYVGKLIKGITETTRVATRETVATWVETGRALPDLVKTLIPVFGRGRAELIAATEVTRAYDEANDLVRQRVGLPATAFKAPAHPGCRCYTRPVLLPNGTWVVVWASVKDERVCQRPVDAPWGRVNGCQALQGVIVSEGDYLGRLLSDVKAAVK